MLLLLLLLLLPPISPAPDALPGCPDSCGNLTIPYPFGTQPGCYLPGFRLTCNSSYSPPKTFVNVGNLEVTSLSLSGTLTVLARVARDCYAPLSLGPNFGSTWIDVTGLPYSLSSSRNKFTALGCDTVALNYRLAAAGRPDLYYTSGCVSFCNDRTSITNGSCSGIGCCQTSIPRGMQRIDTILRSLKNHTDTWTISPCSFAFLVDQEDYVFHVSDLQDFISKNRAPMVLDWAVGNNQSCSAAAASGGYACGDNTDCLDSDSAPGYRCLCKNINECEDPAGGPCSAICENTPGSYLCYCPKGYAGDGKKSGSGCTKQTKSFPLLQVVLGSGLGFLFLLLGGCSLYWVLKKRRLLRLKEKFFLQNGGLLLQQQLAAHEGRPDTAARIFTAEELKRATDNYSDSRILGHGGNGTVYRGVLQESNRVVAIKKSKYVDETQIEQFINEVVLLSQVIHKHVVRILGCCLETPVPLLVYEFVPNGTLQHHLHSSRGSLSWEARLRIASETAGALAYLHSAIARPIFHRDVKAANILLDENYMAKVSDFGASRLIPLDRAEITTLVQGTLGYLDPEYFQTGQLTEKSDVYSFGVVLAEMMTGMMPLSSERPPEEKNLAIYFLLRMKEERLLEMVEPRVRNEGTKEQLEAVANLAVRCLRLKGEDRPAMREVAAELDRLRRTEEPVVWVTAPAPPEVVEDYGSPEMETRYYTSPITRDSDSLISSSRYYSASRTRDESLDAHIMLTLEMQR
ncbi:Wall-associated receptor kinase 2 [Apostasia shenzhenica]|uniref:Wall-associated receptor kinase 2 n=1 Tax=Apostasia shenzhenica TaxID=1088818 RepID=A0A2I0B279_9ASPA|nr:Wall-associated receptor kinase 2 [Apostasia shenzhenica]